MWKKQEVEDANAESTGTDAGRLEDVAMGAYGCSLLITFIFSGK